MSSAPSPQIDHQQQLLTNQISHALRLQTDLLSNLSNQIYRAATSSFSYDPVIPAIQQPALIESGNVFDFHNVFKTLNRASVGIPAVSQQDVIFKLLGINPYSPKVPVINSVIPRNWFNFAPIFTNQFDRGFVAFNPTNVMRKPTLPNVVKVPESKPKPLTTPGIKKMELNPDSIEELETSAEIPEGDIDTSVEIFTPVVVEPNRLLTTRLPKKRPNYNPETGERIDNSVETFRPVTKNTVPTTIFNDKLTQDPEGAKLSNET